MDGLVGYVLAKGYVDKTLAGVGSIAGAACQIQSITPVTGGNNVVFVWQDNTGASHISAPMFVADGQSAYDLWVAAGNSGTPTDFLNALKGAAGDSAYKVWLDAGNTGSVSDFFDSLKGKSAYQVWIDAGNTGTQQDFIDSLKGDSGASLLIAGTGIALTPDATTGELTISATGGALPSGVTGVADSSDMGSLW